jgi:hypothetical protein
LANARLSEIREDVDLKQEALNNLGQDTINKVTSNNDLLLANY